MEIELKYFKLDDAWKKSFTSGEQKTIASIYQPFGLGTTTMSDSGTIISTSQTKFSFLSGLIGWFNNPDYYNLGVKLVTFIDSFTNDCDNILDLHFYYQNKIQFYYRNRELQKNALGLAIKSCLEQIDISDKTAEKFKEEKSYHGDDYTLPIHIGYKQLAIIYDKQAKWNELIILCEKAKKQKWKDNWDKRITKAVKRLKLESK